MSEAENAKRGPGRPRKTETIVVSPEHKSVLPEITHAVSAPTIYERLLDYALAKNNTLKAAEQYAQNHYMDTWDQLTEAIGEIEEGTRAI